MPKRGLFNLRLNNMSEESDNQVTSESDPESIPEPEDENEAIGKEAQPLTQSEIIAMRMMIRRELMEIKRGSKERAEIRLRKAAPFQVPKEHPVFDGDPANLEPFIVEMELVHEKETRGKAAGKQNTSFITKLISYFKDGSAAKTQFRMWASERQKNKKILSWNALVDNLREIYQPYDQGYKAYKKFWELKQSGDIKSYIASKSEAALQSADINPAISLYGFLHGLRSDFRNYVNLHRPGSLEEAQKHAIAYENSGSAEKSFKRLRENSSNQHSQDTSDKGKKKKKIKRTADQEAALKEIRSLRDKDSCFKCGETGHKAFKCKASEKDTEAFQQKIANLKERMNDKK
jgi:Zinc knuckle